MRIEACAKLNLGLEVVRQRGDGYHDIRSLMQSIALTDTLEISAASRPDGGKVRLRCPGSSLPPGEDNLVCRSVRALQERADRRDWGVSVVLRKRIPIGGGLGGGSSDAAAALVGLNRLWRLRFTRPELVSIASAIGSDVAFFIRGGTQLVSGRGDVLEPIPSMPRLPVAVIDPGLSMSTAEIYNSQYLQLTPNGPLSRLHPCDLTTRYFSLSCIARLHNDLEPAVAQRERKVARILHDLRASGSWVVRVTGSGSCIFVLAEDQRKLSRMLEDAPVRGCRVLRTHFTGRGWFPSFPEGHKEDI